MQTTTTQRFLATIDQLMADGHIKSLMKLGSQVSGIYPQRIANMKKGKASVTTPLLQNLCQRFPFLNANYILGTSEAIYIRKNEENEVSY